MTHIRKMMTQEMLHHKLKEKSMSKKDYLKLGDLKFTTNETEMTQKNWRMEDSAQPVSKFINSTGVGEQKKFYYEMFSFRGSQYKREDSILLFPENTNEKPYVAIIKNIYVQGKEKYVKLDVQWFYRPKDVEKKYVGKWERKDSREVFYSFHRDEVDAESVKFKCLVHFVPENKQLPNRRDHRGFIVQKVYDCVNKKLMKFNYKGFNIQQKNEINVLLAKTTSQVGHLPEILKKQKTMFMRCKRSTPHKFIANDVRPIPQNSSLFDGESIWNTTESCGSC